MSTHTESDHGAHGGTSHEPSHYIKIWAILVVLLVVSVVGPMFGIRVLTLITAFGIACVKAFLVIKHFMHLTVEKKVAQYAIFGCLALMVLFFFAIAPDVMKHYGVNWENQGARNMKAVILASEPHHEGAAAGGHEAAAGHEAAPSAGHEAAPAEAPAAGH